MYSRNFLIYNDFIVPIMQPNYNYYEEFCKMSILNLAIK